MRSTTRGTSLSIDSTILASTDQVSCDVAGEVVLLSMRDGEYYGLNEVGASIWKLIQQPRTGAQVRDALLSEYGDVDAAECEREVLAFLEEMIAMRLVELV